MVDIFMVIVYSIWYHLIIITVKIKSQHGIKTGLSGCLENTIKILLIIVFMLIPFKNVLLTGTF